MKTSSTGRPARSGATLVRLPGEHGRLVDTAGDGAGVPAQYEFFTLNKKKERDPVAWTVGVENTCGGFTQVGAESVAA